LRRNSEEQQDRTAGRPPEKNQAGFDKAWFQGRADRRGIKLRGRKENEKTRRKNEESRSKNRRKEDFKIFRF